MQSPHVGANPLLIVVAMATPAVILLLVLGTFWLSSRTAMRRRDQAVDYILAPLFFAFMAAAGVVQTHSAFFAPLHLSRGWSGLAMGVAVALFIGLGNLLWDWRAPGGRKLRLQIYGWAWLVLWPLLALSRMKAEDWGNPWLLILAACVGWIARDIFDRVRKRPASADSPA